MKLVQILFLSLQWFQANGDPLLFQGISVKKSFDISLKPLPIKPLTFIKEKFTSFGGFKKKHTIQIRDVDNTKLEDMSEGAESVPVGIVIEKKSSFVVPQNIEGSLVYPIPSDVPLVTVPSAPVSEEMEPVTVAPLYVKPGGSQLEVPQSIPPQDTIPLVLVPVVDPPVDPIAPIVNPDPVPVVQELPPATVIVPENVATEQIVSPSVPLPPLLTVPISPQESEVPVVVSPVVAPPLPSVPIIVPPGATPASPPQIVSLVVEQPSIPGSVLIPSGSLVPGPILSTGTIEDLAPVPVQPPLNTVPLVNKGPNFITEIFRVAPGLLNTPFRKRISPIESNSIDGSVNQNESSFIRGSKRALYLGNVLLQAVSQVFSNARITLDRLSNPPPIYLN